ncbi:MAG: hypothetical protein R3293_12775, partial [Candidatus Promineifilaceae bacterium]|nr:hypothetical protein [Candidatus Promineifilaceae bacterium]
HEKQRWGINIGWTNDADSNTEKRERQWFFVHDGSDAKPILYEEPIALGWKGKKNPYVRYAKRNFGINLKWSRGPSLEWQIIGGKKGTPVSTGEWVCLFNVRVGNKGGEPFIWFPSRAVGGHIGWPSSEGWFGQMSKWAGKEVNEAIKEARDKAKSEGWKLALTGGQ